MPDLSWMAWTRPTAFFFIAILLFLLIMAIWEWRRPGGNQRKGILGIVTTRGDRLFISFLCAAYIHLAWLFATDHNSAYATILSFFRRYIYFSPCVESFPRLSLHVFSTNGRVSFANAHSKYLSN